MSEKATTAKWMLAMDHIVAAWAWLWALVSIVLLLVKVITGF